MAEENPAAQKQTAVTANFSSKQLLPTAYFSSKQLLLFVFAMQISVVDVQSWNASQNIAMQFISRLQISKYCR